MNGKDLVSSYTALAGQLGTSVKMVAHEGFGTLLADFVKDSGAKKVALSEAGWPPALLNAVKGALAVAGVMTVSPVEKTPGVFEFDRAEVDSACMGIGFCENFLAREGTLAFASGPGAFTASSLLGPVHLAVSLSTGVLGGLGALFTKTGLDMPSRLILVAGPSRTGDIEASMTTCVHGPGRVHHWIIED